jgi:VIT1/CCC1 family predicted Fe2+/Mn2+ transporter
MIAPLKKFIDVNLDVGDRLGEILFGLIMALGFTGAVRLGHEEPDNRTLFMGILGCNIAWGIVDGVMYVLSEVFERGRRARVIQQVRAAPDEAAALQQVAAHLDERLAPVLRDEERRQVYRRVLAWARSATPERADIRREDLFGGMAVGIVVIAATLPMVAPYLLFANPHIAARISNAIGLVMLFLLGKTWGKHAGGNSWQIGLGLTFLGMLLVGITIALGG